MSALFAEINKYMSMVKFSHTIFGLPFALIGFTYGYFNHNHDSIIQTLLLVVLCMVSGRNAAMGFNRYVDRKYDKLNPRTAIREIPSGAISEKNAILFIIVNILIFVTATFFINKLSFYLSPVALLFILGYSLTKRFTALCHLFLGVALGIAPVGAYIAVAGDFAPLPIALSVMVTSWVAGFDILYALQDEEFDKNNALNSIPAKFGRKGALIISAILHLITISCIVYVGLTFLNHAIYWIGGVAFILILIWEHIVVTPKNITRVNLAFATMNGVASIIYALFTCLAIFINQN